MVIMPCNIKLPFHIFLSPYICKICDIFQDLYRKLFFHFKLLTTIFFCFLFHHWRGTNLSKFVFLLRRWKVFFSHRYFSYFGSSWEKGFSCHFSFFSNWQTWWKTIEGEMTEWENMDFPFIWYFFIWRDKLIFICLSLVCAFKEKEKLEMMEC